MVERFETRKLVDRAKGLLNEKMGLSEPEAFRWIQKASMDRRLTMHDVAQAIIDQLAAEEVSVGSQRAAASLTRLDSDRVAPREVVTTYRDTAFTRST